MTKITTNERYQQDEVLSAVFAADSVLLFSHIFPDGDTLGSALAMKLRLERAGWEMQQSKAYDYIVTNDRVETCAAKILEIIAQREDDE